VPGRGALAAGNFTLGVEESGKRLLLVASGGEVWDKPASGRTSKKKTRQSFLVSIKGNEFRDLAKASGISRSAFWGGASAAISERKWGREGNNERQGNCSNFSPVTAGGRGGIQPVAFVSLDASFL